MPFKGKQQNLFSSTPCLNYDRYTIKSERGNIVFTVRQKSPMLNDLQPVSCYNDVRCQSRVNGSCIYMQITYTN